MALPAAALEIEKVREISDAVKLPPYRAQISVAETFRELMVASLGLFVALLVRVAADILGRSDTIQFQYWYTVGVTFLALAVLFYSCGSAFRGAFVEISERRFGAPFCISFGLLATGAGIIYGLFFDFVKLASTPLWSSALAVAWLVALGSLMQALIDRRASRSIGYNYPPLHRPIVPTIGMRTAEAAPEPRIYERGQKLVLGANEWVPVDAAIIGGKGEVWERRYGGSLRRRFKTKGQEIFAGSYVKSGELQCVVVSRSSESTILPFVEALNKIILDESRAPLRKALLSSTSALLVFLSACVVLFWRERGASPFELFDLAAGVLFCVAFLRLLSHSYLPAPIAITKLFLRGCLVRGTAMLNGLARAKNLVLHYSALEAFRKLRVIRFEMMDNRIDKHGLSSVILALCGDGEDPISEAVFDAVSREVTDPTLHEVSDFRLYTGRGLYGSVQGAELSLGDEEFMVERGVQLQTSDLPELQQGQEALYFAVRDDVMARFIVSRQVAGGKSDEKLLRRLERRGVRPLLCGAADSARVDALAKEINIELTASHGGLRKSVMIEKFESWRPLAVYSGEEFDPELSARAEVSIVDFSELRWNIADADVTLYRPSLRLVVEALEEARGAVRRSRILVYCAALVALVLLPLAFLAFIQPVVALVIAVFSQLVGLLLVRAPAVLEIEA